MVLLEYGCSNNGGSGLSQVVLVDDIPDVLKWCMDPYKGWSFGEMNRCFLYTKRIRYGLINDNLLSYGLMEIG